MLYSKFYGTCTDDLFCVLYARMALSKVKGLIHTNKNHALTNAPEIQRILKWADFYLAL